jgi:hypothetical protein
VRQLSVVIPFIASRQHGMYKAFMSTKRAKREEEDKKRAKKCGTVTPSRQ